MAWQNLDTAYLYFLYSCANKDFEVLKSYHKSNKAFRRPTTSFWLPEQREVELGKPCAVDPVAPLMVSRQTIFNRKCCIFYEYRSTLLSANIVCLGK